MTCKYIISVLVIVSDKSWLKLAIDSVTSSVPKDVLVIVSDNDLSV